ncbi:MAG: hypothetical protein ACYT04_77545 [Nostoc sp.]
MSQVTQAFPYLDLETVKQKEKLATSPNRETKMAGYIQCDRRPKNGNRDCFTRRGVQRVCT